MEFSLNSGHKMPAVIFGTFEIKNHQAKQTILDALKIGYTHIDCAAVYQNEAEIGEALAESFDTGISTRDKLYITTKAWCSKYRNIREACLNSLKRLRVSYVDLYLLHWPFAIQPEVNEPPIYIPGKANLDHYPLHLAWAQMEALVDEGLVKSIGVSNWTIALLNDLMGYARIKPVTNQFEINPYNSKKELVNFCLQHEIIPIAYRVIYRPPVTSLFPFQKCILDDPLIIELSKKYGKTSAQILLRWCLSRNCSFVVKTVTPARMLENYQSQNFNIDQKDLDRINDMPFEGVYNDTYQKFGIHIFK